MKQLDTIIQNLKSRRGQRDSQDRQLLYAVSITDNDKGTVIANNMTAPQMEEQAGTVEEYFNQLFRNGVRNVVIMPRRKNGSTFTSAGAPVSLNFEPDTPKAMETTPTPSPTLHQAVPMPPQTGLMGGLMGTMEGAYRIMSYPELKAENERLKEKLEDYKEKIEDYKEKLLENKYSADKANGNKEMLTGLFEVLAPIATTLITKGATGGMGLGQPAAAAADLSPIKSELINAIMEHDENVAQYLMQVFALLLANPSFGNEIEKLLQTYKSTPAA